MIYSGNVSAASVKYDISLVDNEAKQIKIADLYLYPVNEGFSFDLDMITQLPFEDYFLSMRPFKCLHDEANDRDLCYLPYPYEVKRLITKNDLTDLEYELLFIRRKATDYGIDPWHGSYYKLSWDGEQRIIGRMLEVDLDVLASPPEDNHLRPIMDDILTEIEEPEKFWLPEILIEVSQ